MQNKVLVADERGYPDAVKWAMWGGRGCACAPPCRSKHEVYVIMLGGPGVLKKGCTGKSAATQSSLDLLISRAA